MKKSARRTPLLTMAALSGAALSGTVLSGTAFAAPSGDRPLHYVEADGVVVFEPETIAELAPGWRLDTSIPDYQGTGYLVWDGDNHYREVEAGEGTLTFHFTIDEPGNYQLLWRSRIAVGESDKEHNDSWARMSTGTDVPDEHPLQGWTKAYMNDLDTWSWSTKTVDGEGFPLRQYFAAGDHTLEISGRSTGHAIDRVVLLSYETRSQRPATLEALPVSETTGGDGEGAGEDGAGADGGTDAGTDDYRADNARDVPPGDAIPIEDIGECVDERVALAPIDDVHESADGYVDIDRLTFEAEHRALLKFDLRAVPSPTAATLRYTTLDTLERDVTFALGAHSAWPDDPDAPDFLADLGAASARWREEARFASTLDPSLFQPDYQTLLLSGPPGAAALSVAASEDPAQGPRLVLEGGPGFCDTRAQMLDAIAAEEAPPPEPTPEPTPEPSPEPSPEPPPEETPEPAPEPTPERTTPVDAEPPAEERPAEKAPDAVPEEDPEAAEAPAAEPDATTPGTGPAPNRPQARPARGAGGSSATSGGSAGSLSFPTLLCGALAAFVRRRSLRRS